VITWLVVTVPSVIDTVGFEVIPAGIVAFIILFVNGVMEHKIPAIVNVNPLSIKFTPVICISSPISTEEGVILVIDMGAYV